MDKPMTLEQVRDKLLKSGELFGLKSDECCDLADAIDAHLAREPVKVPAERALHARHYAEDEPKYDPDYMGVANEVYFWRLGWNSCRKAMIAQGNGGVRDER